MHPDNFILFLGSTFYLEIANETINNATYFLFFDDKDRYLHLFPAIFTISSKFLKTYCEGL